MANDVATGATTEGAQPLAALPRETLSAQSRTASDSLSDAGNSVELHIEELVLHGFPAGDRYRVGEALERELTRLFTERDVPSSISHNIEGGSMDAGSFNVAPGADAETIGIQIARALYEGMT